MRHHTSYGDDALQTDVMRFMAIIAFCLIAVLALVRVTPSPSQVSLPSVEPAPVEPEVLPPEPVNEPERRATVSEAASPRTAATAPEKAPEKTPEQISEEAPERPPGNVPQMTPAGVAKPAMPATPAAQSASASPRSQTTARPAPSRQSPPQPQPVQLPDRNETAPGLALRFASNQDFLRLITRGDARLFAHTAEGFVALDADFRFVEASPPDLLYEVMPATIPATVSRIAPEDVSLWGVALPGTIATAIAGLVARHDSGELVINRYGEVRHDPY